MAMAYGIGLAQATVADKAGRDNLAAVGGDPADADEGQRAARWWGWPLVLIEHGCFCQHHLAWT